MYAPLNCAFTFKYFLAQRPEKIILRFFVLNKFEVVPDLARPQSPSAWISSLSLKFKSKIKSFVGDLETRRVTP